MMCLYGCRAVATRPGDLLTVAFALMVGALFAELAQLFPFPRLIILSDISCV